MVVRRLKFSPGESDVPSRLQELSSLGNPRAKAVDRLGEVEVGGRRASAGVLDRDSFQRGQAAVPGVDPDAVGVGSQCQCSIVGQHSGLVLLYYFSVATATTTTSGLWVQ